ncbi:MAG: S26 family signal peptidase [Methanomassiliicoccales archaeon]|nr:S26 family signal peptidase [Methanomassiliicoccales archaeon]NYT15204.1 S26 family signal peptidase [Methanomassiliicoccales archaeon]
MPQEDRRSKGIPGAIKGVIVAVVVVVIIMASLYAYTGKWPPMVVVESDSMQHSSDRSFIGIIDTGDLVLVKEKDPATVITYLQGQEIGYQTYGEYGDVIIYQRYGNPNYKSIIHRTMCRVEYNTTGGGFDVPELADIPADQWNVLGSSQQVWWNLDGIVEIYDIGYMEVTIHLDLGALINYFHGRGRVPHSGFITMGDHNMAYQGGELVGLYDQLAICREPIQYNWVLGAARGELPWFGLFKLWVTGEAPDNVPQNSVTNLWLTLGIIIGVPIVLDVTTVIMKHRGVDIWAWTKRFGLRRSSKEKDECLSDVACEPEKKGPKKKIR